MVPVKVGEKFDYEAVNIDSDWNDSNDSELIMHTNSFISSKISSIYSLESI